MRIGTARHERDKHTTCARCRIECICSPLLKTRMLLRSLSSTARPTVQRQLQHVHGPVFLNASGAGHGQSQGQPVCPQLEPDTPPATLGNVQKCAIATSHGSPPCTDLPTCTGGGTNHVGEHGNACKVGRLTAPRSAVALPLVRDTPGAAKVPQCGKCANPADKGHANRNLACYASKLGDQPWCSYQPRSSRDASRRQEHASIRSPHHTLCLVCHSLPFQNLFCVGVSQRSVLGFGHKIPERDLEQVGPCRPITWGGDGRTCPNPTVDLLLPIRCRCCCKHGRRSIGKDVHDSVAYVAGGCHLTLRGVTHAATCFVQLACRFLKDGAVPATEP